MVCFKHHLIEKGNDEVKTRRQLFAVVFPQGFHQGLITLVDDFDRAGGHRTAKKQNDQETKQITHRLYSIGLRQHNRHCQQGKVSISLP